MSTHDHSVKTSADSDTKQASQEISFQDDITGLSGFYGLRRAIQKPSKETLTSGAVLQLQRTIGNQAVIKMLSQTGKPTIQRAPNRNGLNIYDDNSEIDLLGRTTRVTATIEGPALPLGANSPEEFPAGWDELSREYDFTDHVRAHLWNGRCGGLGVAWNLIPLPNYLNQAMGEEEAIIQEALTYGHTITLETTIQYHNPPTLDSPLHYYPSKVRLEWSSNNDPEGEWETDVPLPRRLDTSYDDNISQAPDDWNDEMEVQWDD